MDRIISSDVLDLMPHEGGFLYADKVDSGDGNVRVAFFSYEQDSKKVYPVTTKAYLQHKFGREFKAIAEQLGDFLTCTSAILSNNGVTTLYDTGEMYIFNPNGTEAWHGNLTYQDEPVRDLAVDGKCVWCTVPDRNAIISYSPAEGRVLLRIGGGATSAFSYPVSVSKYGDTLYVCNKNSFKIRTVRLSDYSVKDYLVFKEPVLRFFKVLESEYVVLESGIYKV